MTRGDPVSAPPGSERADLRLRAGRLGEPDLRKLAQRLAVLQESAVPSPDALRHAGPDALAARASALHEQTATVRGSPEVVTALRRVAGMQAHFVATHADWIRARVDAGCIRLGTHDFRLANVWIDGDGNVTLAGEAGAALQRAPVGRDGCVPVAALSADLASRGHPELAERLLSAYADESDDHALYHVVGYYERDHACAWALARLHEASGREAPAALGDAATAEARRWLDFVCSDVRRPLQRPAVVALGGLVASGKSTVARAVADLMASPRIVGDHVRAFRMGATPSHDPTPVERLESLEPDFERKVTRSFFDAAECVVDSGRAVVLDAGFPNARRRAAARELAQRHGLPFRFIECRVDPATARRRLAARDAVPDGHGGWRAIYDRYLARWESPEDDVVPDEHIVIDTTRPLDENLARIAARLPRWPEGSSA